MNKTINMNLGGLIFHIDENAYALLKNYLEAVSNSLNEDVEGKTEIIADIEARISELLSEKTAQKQQAIQESDIDEVILVMGQPEDYSDAPQDANDESSAKTATNAVKKLYRDGDNRFLGGVASGIGHYVKVDAIWFRFAFLVAALGGGFGIPIYILLWVLVPEAKTSIEKLEMEGAPVNIDNIEKTIHLRSGGQLPAHLQTGVHYGLHIGSRRIDGCSIACRSRSNNQTFYFFYRIRHGLFFFICKQK